MWRSLPSSRASACSDRTSRSGEYPARVANRARKAVRRRRRATFAFAPCVRTRTARLRRPTRASSLSLYRVPAARDRSGQTVGCESVRSGWVLKHSTKAADARKRGGEAAPVIAWAVVLSSPAPEVERGKVGPQLARRMRNNGMRTHVSARVACGVPRIYVGAFEIDPIRFDEERGDHSLDTSFSPIPIASKACEAFPTTHASSPGESNPLTRSTMISFGTCPFHC